MKASLCTCSKLVGGDSKGLYLQTECVEGERWRHGQNLLCVAHVGVAERATQVAQTGVTGWKRSYGWRLGQDKGVNKHCRNKGAVCNIPAISDQLACKDSLLRWYLLFVEFFEQEKQTEQTCILMWLHLFKRKDALTRVKVKLSMVVCCVRLKVALLVSHEPVELVTLGLRFTNDCIVWEGRYRHVLFQVCYKGWICDI